MPIHPFKNQRSPQRPDCAGPKREASAWLILCFAAGLLWPAAASGLEPNAVEEALAKLIVGFPTQKRAEMIHDPILLLAARAKAEDMGTRDYAAHVDPDGYGPNAALKAAGYGLPAWWDDQSTIASNTVESLGYGYGGSAATIFAEWLLSPAHRWHVLGEEPFFAEQTHFAVGYAHVPGSQHKDYFVFMSAPPNESAYKELEPYSEWLFERFSVKEILSDGDETDPDGDGLSRLLEFVLDKDPNQSDYLPAPRPVTASSGKRAKLEWPLHLRKRLGSVDVFFETSRDLDGWQRRDVRREGDLIILDMEGPAGFFRLSAQRPHSKGG